MTRETAINLLDDLIGMVEDNQQNDYDEAFKLAIRSLEAWDDLEEDMETEEKSNITNRDYLRTLSNYDLSSYIYTYLIPVIGKAYNNSVLGIAEWFGEEHYRE